MARKKKAQRTKKNSIGRFTAAQVRNVVEATMETVKRTDLVEFLRKVFPGVTQDYGFAQFGLMGRNFGEFWNGLDDGAKLRFAERVREVSRLP